MSSSEQVKPTAATISSKQQQPPLPTTSNDNPLSNLNIGFIGTGAMNSSIISGLLSSKLVTPSQIYTHDTNIDILHKCVLKHSIQKCQSNSELINTCHVIILGVKPQALESVLFDCSKALKNCIEIKKEILLISIAAGFKLENIKNLLLKNIEIDFTKYIKLSRVMPNINCMIGESASGYIMHNNSDLEYSKIVQLIFSKIGKCVYLENESYLDCVTGLSGSGPAFVFMFIDALVDAGVTIGLNRETSLLLATQTVLGSAKLLMENTMNGNSSTITPSQMKDQVMSPNGTTARGLLALEQGNFKYSVMNAVISAYNRSVELGQPIKNSKL